ncbi:MAG: BTAD domain-containing putative transcriptional regulator [Catenulispora sp.]
MEFKILGPLEVWSPAGRVVLSGAKRQVVLATLLLAPGRPVPLDRLIDAVWGTQSPPTAGKQIRNAVSDLRALLAGAAFQLAPTGVHYRLEFDVARLDAAQFTKHTAEARRLRDVARTAEAAAELRAALRLWRGEALAGLDSPALQAQVVGLNQERLTAFEECVDLELALGRHRELIGELTEAVAERPLHEPLVARLMTAHVASGAAAAALRVYDTARRHLQEELGTDPSAQLQRLYLKILAGDTDAPAARTVAAPGASFPACNTLPPAPPLFAGRAVELGHLVAAARGHDPQSSAGPAVIVADGMAGIGKTALAVHAAHRLAPYYPDAQLAVDLRAYARRDGPPRPVEALGTLLRAIGVPADRIPASLPDRGGLWRSLTAGRRILLLLDDADSAEQVAPLVPAAPGSLVLVTSRGRLAGLDGTHHLTLSELTPADGRDLFARVLADARPHAEPDAVEEVLRLCGLHPQAVRLAAVKLRHRPGWTVGDLARRLAGRDGLLAELRAGDAGLAAGLDRSLQRLSPGQQQIFRLLRHLPGPRIDVSQAAELVRRPEHATEEVLECLVEAQLLNAAAPGVYRIHPVVHAFAAQLAPVG